MYVHIHMYIYNYVFVVRGLLCEDKKDNPLYKCGPVKYNIYIGKEKRF